METGCQDYVVAKWNNHPQVRNLHLNLTSMESTSRTCLTAANLGAKKILAQLPAWLPEGWKQVLGALAPWSWPNDAVRNVSDGSRTTWMGTASGSVGGMGKISDARRRGLAKSGGPFWTKVQWDKATVFHPQLNVTTRWEVAHVISVRNNCSRELTEVSQARHHEWRPSATNGHEYLAMIKRYHHSYVLSMLNHILSLPCSNDD